MTQSGSAVCIAAVGTNLIFVLVLTGMPRIAPRRRSDCLIPMLRADRDHLRRSGRPARYARGRVREV